KEQRTPPLSTKRREALIPVGSADCQEIENRRRGVDQADDMSAANGGRQQSWRGNQKRDPYVLLVQLKRVPIVAIVLAERFPVIARAAPERPSVQTTLAQAAHAPAGRRA